MIKEPALGLQAETLLLLVPGFVVLKPIKHVLSFDLPEPTQLCGDILDLEGRGSASPVLVQLLQHHQLLRRRAPPTTLQPPSTYTYMYTYACLLMLLLLDTIHDDDIYVYILRTCWDGKVFKNGRPDHLSTCAVGVNGVIWTNFDFITTLHTPHFLLRDLDRERGYYAWKEDVTL